MAFNHGNSTVSGWDTVNTAAGTGISFAHTAGYTSPGAAVVYSSITNNIIPGYVTKVTPAPAITTPLTTEMTDYGDTALIYDADLDFTTVGNLTTGDYILINFN